MIASLFDEVERRPLSVTELTQQVRGALESRFASVWVEGEISNFKAHTSGHWYFTIKDQGAQLRAKCFRGVNFRIKFRPENGLQVRARGRISVYEPRGDYELVVEALDPVGAGALQVAFEQMRDRLAKEGLFNEELKRALPLFPRRVGIVTSTTGAAIRDIINVLQRRTRTVHMLVAPARVQGEGAGQEIASAINLINAYHARSIRDGHADRFVDVIIVGRGGGSAEDLWAFNDEVLARAIRGSAIPVISAVGHATDFTIADFVADVRAPTPSAAAELVASREDELCASVQALRRELERSTKLGLLNARKRWQTAAMSHGFDDVRESLHDASRACDRAMHRLRILLAQHSQAARRRIEGVAGRMSLARLGGRTAALRTQFNRLRVEHETLFRARVEDARNRFGVAAAALDALSPLSVLQRGYAIARDEAGHAIRDAGDVHVGQRVHVRLARGALGCRVEETENA